MDRPDTTFGEWHETGVAGWQRWLAALGSVATAARGADASAAGIGPAAAGFASLGEASSAFARFAQDFARNGQGAGTAAETARLTAELQSLAQRFHASALPAWPAPQAAGPEWTAALAAWSMVLADIARDTAARYAARLAAVPPLASLRAAFDAWIDCAEAAFQAAAHSEAFTRAQARLINELVAARGRQQALLEQGARALGLPTRSEVDGLHAAIRELRRGRDPTPSSTSTPPRAGSPGARSRAKRKR
jgi:hypothetical protein